MPVTVLSGTGLRQVSVPQTFPWNSVTTGVQPEALEPGGGAWEGTYCKELIPAAAGDGQAPGEHGLNSLGQELQ